MSGSQDANTSVAAAARKSERSKAHRTALRVAYVGGSVARDVLLLLAVIAALVAIVGVVAGVLWGVGYLIALLVGDASIEAQRIYALLTLVAITVLVMGLRGALGLYIYLRDLWYRAPVR
jgi:hypothetical protein